ncbi:hypothetical protein BDQ17DRAFT_1420447 [Cyathus striatus]|nr:hypothetical protein BDQ17DRAFT_1420447 [Cyathus striatus]
MGSHKQVPFTEKAAETRYKAHLLDLVAWSGLNKVITKKIWQRLCDRALAGIDDNKEVAPQLVGDLLESARRELDGRTGDSDVEGETDADSDRFLPLQ